MKKLAIVISCLLVVGLFIAPAAHCADAVAAIAADRGAAYLKKAVNADAYGLACKVSDGSACPVDTTGHVFAGFFIAEAISGELSPVERQKILARLDAEERQGVWGYMSYAPVDADDTAFVIRTYGSLGKRVSPDGLLRFYDEEARAFTTFDRKGGERLVFDPSLAGNAGFHPEVNANVFTLLAQTPLVARINDGLMAQAQAQDGHWRSFFYPGDYYGTYTVLNLLCKTGRLGDARKKGTDFLLRSQNPDGSWGIPGGSYETALALNALVACHPSGEASRRGVAWLLAHQAPDGSWRDARTVIWEYIYSENPLVVWRALDTDGIVTTALAVMALRSASGIAVKP